MSPSKTLFGACILTVFSFANANHIRSSPHHHFNLHRRHLTSRALPTGWSQVGCYTDDVAQRTLSSATYTSTTAMTVESCVNYCNAASFDYAGVEYAQECYCADAIGGQGAAAAATDCSMPCTGNANEICGGGDRLNLYWNGQTPPAGPTNPAKIGSWSSLGCYNDSVPARVLANEVNVVGQVTLETCTQACYNAGYKIAGAEYAGQCFCDNKFENHGAPIASSLCNMACVGNAAEICGGPNALTVYSYSTGPSVPATVGSWTSLGCYNDSAAARVLGTTIAMGQLTLESCTAACHKAGFSLAGAEYAGECYCDNKFENYGAPIAASSCNMACNGNGAEYCGGPNALNVYNYTGSATVGGGTPTPGAPVIVPSTGGWVSLGCYNDSVTARVLSTPIAVTGQVSIETCTTACKTAGFTLAGAEYADECYCDNKIENYGAPIAAATCSMTCAGNSSEYCGGPNALNLYNLTGAATGGTTTPGAPIIVPSVGNWTSLGCYNDSVGVRTLANPVAVTGQVTIESCTQACFNNGFNISGTEYADECYCDTHFENYGAPIAASLCSMTCVGNSSEYCGGSNALNVYKYTGTNLPTLGGGGGPVVGAGGTVYPVTSGLPTPWTYNGCWIDNANGRIFTDAFPDNNALTVESCIATCQAANYTLAGLEYSLQCYCGNELIDGAAPATDNGCNMGCSGNTTEACGGPNRLSVYTSTGNVTALPIPTAQKTDLPGQWVYQGCLNDLNPGRVLPHQLILTTNNSATTCLNQCAAYGYTAASTEYGDECYCGDVSDVTAAGTGFAPDADCFFTCTGDPLHYCGGPLVMSLYYWNGALNTWHTPANTGYYSFLVPGVVVPLIATVGLNNKVTFLEKAGTSLYPNSTGAYELDLSLVDQFDLAWREMHVKTDVFCSGALVLPDKGGRLINIGGWSLDSTFGVRLYTPGPPSPGVNSTNDWEENVDELTLQAGRWYPSAVLLSNGSILVVGGETGSNASPQPNLEILPTIPGGSTLVNLDFLARTDPWNLYPFLIILPSGNVFIGYYNEARILDKVTFDTVTTLPNIPGAVNDPTAGRTYPLEGTAVILPQYPPYTNPLQILICGGSSPPAGAALDSCVSIAPEDPNPVWTIERMPSPRVMPCMAALPDGTYMIMNGAMQGAAGFGLASEPNLNALLYDPSQPLNSRISILGNTIVARLYHSEATLLPDGRVLISGSDPQTYYPNGTSVYPEEFRIEAYYPPYLTDGNQQPTYTIHNTDWTYGATYQIQVNLFQGTSSTMRVSLIAATSSTHGNMMGGRTLFPAFTCAGNVCIITAPPNAQVCPPGWFQLFVLDGPTPSHSQWVRIGGDPAALGNWPNFPDFTLPGV